MQDALESLFGPGVGLLGFAVMIFLFAPKVMAWRKKRRTKKQEAQEAQQQRDLGMRAMRMAPSQRVTTSLPHPVHGEAIDTIGPDKKSVFLASISWICPCILALWIVPQGEVSLRAAVTIGSVFLVFIGAMTLLHIHDHIQFYRTGMIGTIRGKSFTMDYNTICDVTRRPALLPWMAPTYLLHLDNNQLMAIDVSYLSCSHDRIDQLLKTLAPRVIANAAQETMRRL